MLCLFINKGKENRIDHLRTLYTFKNSFMLKSAYEKIIDLAEQK